MYTQQELMQWKSLEAYNYFETGHVRTVETWPVDSIGCILGESVRRPSHAATLALWGLSGDRWPGFTMALRIELMLSTGQVAKDVLVLNGLPKTHTSSNLLSFHVEKGSSASFSPVPEAQLDTYL